MPLRPRLTTARLRRIGWVLLGAVLLLIVGAVVTGVVSLGGSQASAPATNWSEARVKLVGELHDLAAAEARGDATATAHARAVVINDCKHAARFTPDGSSDHANTQAFCSTVGVSVP